MSQAVGGTQYRFRRSELRLIAAGIVETFRSGEEEIAPWFNGGQVASVIRREGMTPFVRELGRAAMVASRKEDIGEVDVAKAYFQMVKDIGQPVVIEYRVSESDLARMGNASGKIIRQLLQAAHDAAAANKHVITRVIVPMRSEVRFALKDHNRMDPVRMQIAGNVATIVNTALEGYERYLHAEATVTVADSWNKEGSALLSDRYAIEGSGEILYDGPDGERTASQMFAAALVLTEESLAERTVQGLVQVDGDSNRYRVHSPDALYAMGYFVELLAQHRSALRIKIAA